MPTKSVLALHDDGRWWPAEILDQYRDRARWRLAGCRDVLDRAGHAVHPSGAG